MKAMSFGGSLARNLRTIPTPIIELVCALSLISKYLVTFKSPNCTV